MHVLSAPEIVLGKESILPATPDVEVKAATFPSVLVA
jgi:hypothetical protein